MFGTKTRAGLCVFVLAYIVNRYFYGAKVDSPIIQIQNGKLQGIIEKSRDGRNYYSYMKIPFAQPPVGQLRFEPPLPYEETWKEVRDARSFGPQCLQFDLIKGRVDGDEDCLFLNVFTPKLKTNRKNLPVLVFIHGGSFLTGSANTYSPKYFMDEDIVLVTVNYRLAALGFLNTGDGVVRGNMGLKDQTMAFKWIQQNIERFGGDPNRVTISGNSAGAASCHFHMLSPFSKGLFHRVISQSGTALSHWAIYKNPKAQTERFASLLNCQNEDSKKMVDCLKNIAPYDLVSVHKEVMTPLRDFITLFVPTIEPIIDENTFLPGDPVDLITKGLINKVPWVGGVNSHEGLLFSAGLYRNDSLVERIRNNFEDVASRLLDMNREEEEESLQKLKEYYVGSGNEDKFHNYTNLFSDRSFFVPLSTSAELQAIHSPVYLYFYSYERDISIAKYLLAAKNRYPVVLEIAYEFISNWIKINVFRVDLPKIGVCHTDELSIFFPVLWDSDIVPGGKDYEMSKDIIKLAVAFANGDKDLEFRGTHWEQVNPIRGTVKYLELGTKSGMVEPSFSSRMEIWKQISTTHFNVTDVVR